MLTGPTRKLLYALALVALLVNPGCKYFSRTSDDQLKEANKVADEADALAAKVDDAYNQATKKEDEIKAEKKDKARIQKVNKEVAALYDQAAQDAGQAADKYEEASKLKVDTKYQEYLKLRSQQMRKRGAQLAALKERSDAMNDPKLKPGSKAYKDKLADAKSRSERLKKETDDLKEQADKMQKENGDKFKAKST
jgi:archaellum component FlaC